MTAPVCCVCLQVLAVCTGICASNVSLYRRTHVHPYLPGRTHQLVFICMYTSVYYTHNQYLCTWTVTHIYTVAGESYANIMWGTSSPPLLAVSVPPFEMYQGIVSILLPRSLKSHIWWPSWQWAEEWCIYAQRNNYIEQKIGSLPASVTLCGIGCTCTL